LSPYAYSRAYIWFKNFEDIFLFRDRFDNYVFVDSKSNEYPALVEFAPYQRRINLNDAQKLDSKCNTIEQDSDYIKFLETFDKPNSEPSLPSCEANLEELEQREKDKLADAHYLAPKVMTPLLEFMRRKKEEKNRLKEVSLVFILIEKCNSI